MLHLAILLSLAQSASNEPSQLAWADFTGNELPDLAAVHPNGTISLYKNTGDGAFEEVTASSALRELKSAVSIEWSDLDGDKDVDLLVTTRAGVRLFENNERRSLHEATPSSPLSKLNSPLTKVSLHDFDRDGLIDLELSTEREHSLWHNKGKWSFEQVRLQLPPSLSPRAEIQPGVLPPGQPAPGKAPAGEITERDPNGGQAQSTISSSGTYLGGGGTFQVSVSAPICAGTIEDASQIGTGVCIPASSIPMAGHLYPLGTEFFIDPGGRIGIGTTMPSAKLELRETNVLDESLVSFEATNGVGNTQDVLDLRMNVVNQNSQFIECEDIGTGETVFVVHSGGGINSKGNANFEGNANFDGDAQIAGQTTIDGSADVGGTLTTGGTLSVHTPPNTTASLNLKNGNSWTGGLRQDSSNRLALFNGGTSSGSNNHVVITDEGRVGVGTYSPTVGYKLTVDGSTNIIGTLDTDGFKMPTGAVDGHVMTTDASGNASWSPSAGGGLSGSGESNSFALWNSSGGLSGSMIAQGPSGELGVANDAIIHGQLTTLDKATIGGLLETTEKLSVHSAGGTNAELKLRNGNSWTGGIRQASNNRLSLFNGGSSSGTNRLTITENGSVGIGNNITTPNNLLSVYGTADIQGNLELENSPDDSKGRIQLKSSQGSLGPNDGAELFMYSDDTLVLDNNESAGAIKLRVGDNENSLYIQDNNRASLGVGGYSNLLSADLTTTGREGHGLLIQSEGKKTRLDLNNTYPAGGSEDGGDCEVRFMTDEKVHFSMGVNEVYNSSSGGDFVENFVISGPVNLTDNPSLEDPSSPGYALDGHGGVGSNRILVITKTGNVGIGTSTPDERLDVAGTTKTRYLEITAGADLVERFEGDSELIIPGKLVAIDPDNPKHIRLTTSAYDSTVLGVLSGAGGINHGIALGQEGVTTGDLPVAMVGRVYAECSTENGPIRPGDLLTSSSIPGVGMKATDTEASFGAVIGKALTGLDDETGLVLVIVNLQ